MKTDGKILVNIFLITFAFLAIWSVYQRAEIENLHSLLDRASKVMDDQDKVIKEAIVLVNQCKKG